MGDGSEDMEVSDIKPDDNVNLSNEEEQAVRLASSNNGDSVKDLLDEVEDQVDWEYPTPWFTREWKQFLQGLEFLS